MGESAAKYHSELDLDEFERRLRAAAPSLSPRQAQGQAQGQAHAAAPASAPDPLAELARLVSGAGEQRADPFEALFRAQKAVAEGAPAFEAPHEPYFQGFGAPRVPDDHYAAEAEPRWSDEASVEAAYEVRPGDFAPQHDAFEPQPMPARGRNKVVYAMGALLVSGVALFAGGLAMKKGVSAGEVATIQADSEPTKIKPSQDEAASGAGQALFDKKDEAGPTRIVTRTEQPADLGTAAKQAQAASAAAVAAPPPPAPASPNASESAQSAEGLMAPKKVRTVSVRSDGSLLGGPEASKAPPANALPSMAAGMPSVASMVPGVAKPVAAPKTVAATPVPSKPAQAAQAKPVPAPKLVAAAEPATGGGWSVQVASARSENEAQDAVGRVTSRFGSALQGRQPAVVSGEKDGAAIYRVRVSRLSKESAESMCNAIKAQGGACFVTK